jgi:hypothetical protein
MTVALIVLPTSRATSRIQHTTTSKIRKPLQLVLSSTHGRCTIQGYAPLDTYLGWC